MGVEFVAQSATYDLQTWALADRNMRDRNMREILAVATGNPSFSCPSFFCPPVVGHIVRCIEALIRSASVAPTDAPHAFCLRGKVTPTDAAASRRVGPIDDPMIVSPRTQRGRPQCAFHSARTAPADPDAEPGVRAGRPPAPQDHSLGYPPSVFTQTGVHPSVLPKLESALGADERRTLEEQLNSADDSDKRAELQRR